MSASTTDLDPLTRLVLLAGEHGMSVDAFVSRLLDRDPHGHLHRCPTCARLAVARDRTEHPDQAPLFDAAG